MCFSIVEHVAPLAERSQVARGVVGRIMVEVGAGDIDPRDTDDRHEVYRPDHDPHSEPVSPLPTIHVPPRSVAQMEYRSEEHTSEIQSLMRNQYAVFCSKKRDEY